MRQISILFFLVLFALIAACGGGGDDASETIQEIDSGSSTGGQTNPVCFDAGGTEDVQTPEFLYNLSGQTGWFASPLVVDLDGDGTNELIAAYYSLYVFDAEGRQLDRADGNGGRVYAPPCGCRCRRGRRYRSGLRPAP